MLCNLGQKYRHPRHPHKTEPIADPWNFSVVVPHVKINLMQTHTKPISYFYVFVPFFSSWSNSPILPTINVTSKCQATSWHLMNTPLWHFSPMYRTIFLKVVNCNHSVMNLSLSLFLEKNFVYDSSRWHSSSPTAFSTAKCSLFLCYFHQHGVLRTVYVIHGIPHDRTDINDFAQWCQRYTRDTCRSH